MRGPAPGRFAILISGRGSNMEALLSAAAAGGLGAEPVLVISNVADAPGLAVARERGVATAVVDHRDSSSREEHDRRVMSLLDERRVDLVCLAGYMRLLSAVFVQAWSGRILNIHPSLLPSFPGLHAQRQALAFGVKVSGCTVHLVDEDLDHGPIVVQEAVPVAEDDDEDSLSARILAAEHRVYPEAVRLYFQGRLSLHGRRVRVTPEAGTG